MFVDILYLHFVKHNFECNVLPKKFARCFLLKERKIIKLLILLKNTKKLSVIIFAG